MEKLGLSVVLKDPIQFIAQSRQRDGFLEQTVYSRPLASVPDVVVCARCEGDDKRRPAVAPELPDREGYLESVHRVHGEVEDQQLEGRLAAGEGGHALYAGTNREGSATELLQELVGDGSVGVVAVHEQDVESVEVGDC